MCPFKPVDNCRLKTNPFVFSGSALVSKRMHGTQ
jgi:hypothetical protein